MCDCLVHRYVKGREVGGGKASTSVGAFAHTVKTGNAFSVCTHRGTYINIYTYISLWKGEQMPHATGNGTWSFALAGEERCN